MMRYYLLFLLLFPLDLMSQQKHFLALGDSYTIGESVAPSQRWPVQLVAQLRTRGLDYAEPTIIATTGWRTDDLRRAIDKAALRPSYDLVSLLIGVNNQYQGKPVAVYEREFSELLQTAIALAGNDPSKVVVLSIPDYGFTPFGLPKKETISAAIDEFNAVNYAIARKARVTYVDITPVSRKGLDRKELVASDGLHPSGEMYREWVRLVIAKLPKAGDER